MTIHITHGGFDVKRKVLIGGIAAVIAYLYYKIGRLDDSWDYQPTDWGREQRRRDGW